MNRTWRALTLIAAVLLLLVVNPASARADDGAADGESVSRFDAAIRVDEPGTATVTLNLDYDFGYTPNHGIYVYLLQQQQVADDPNVWRTISYDVGAVTSNTGAPVDLETFREDGALVLQIGDPDQTVSGTHSYTITYTARGLIAPDQAISGLDELNYNVIGTGWQVPINNVTVSVTGPTTIKQVGCFFGRDYTQPCDATAAASTGTYAVDGLLPGEGMQVVAGFPVGTFTDAEPVYAKRFTPANTFGLTPLSGSLTGALTLLGVGAVLLRTRRSRRDEVYLGLTPGVRPAPGQSTSVGHARSDAPVTVAFTPPKGARPGEIGVLMDATADDVDITATIMDLAVRDHIQIVELSPSSWRFIDRQKEGQLTEAEAYLMGTLFSAGPQVTTEQLASRGYADLLPGTRTRLYDRVTRDLRWFTARPTTVRVMAILSGIGLVMAGVLLGLVLGFTVGLGLVGLAFIVTGILVLAMSNRFGRRTAEGSAVLAEAKGFELYLTTAEADQIKFEEGIDVFSRYLPYAIVFGVAERWAAIFAELARQGRYEPTDWYVGPSGYFYAAAFGNAMNSLSSNLSASMHTSIAAQSQANAATSGGSGFSGGGGFGGGGGGSW